MRLDEPLISPPRRRGRGRESFSALLSQPRKVWFTKIGASFHGICSPRRKVAHFAEVFIVPIDRQGDTSSITPTLMSTNGCLVILLFSERHMPAPSFSPQKRTNFKENRISRGLTVTRFVDIFVVVACQKEEERFPSLCSAAYCPSCHPIKQICH